MNTHQEVIDEFRKQVNYGVQQRTVCAVVVDSYYGTMKTHLDMFKRVHHLLDTDSIELTEIRSYFQGLTEIEVLSAIKDQMSANIMPLFVVMSIGEALRCKSRLDYLCDFINYSEYNKVRIRWENMKSKDALVFDLATLGMVSPTAVTLPPLPPVRVQDDLPPPSPAFQASVSRWCDFDGED